MLSAAAALITAQVLLHDMRADARLIAEHRHQVTATTLAPTGDTAGQPLGTAQTRATWTVAADTRTETVKVPSGTPQGTNVPLWVDDDGAVASPPPADTRIAVSAATCGLITLAGTSTVFAGVLLLRRRVLDHRAAAAWESDWERVEPLWSGRTDRPGTGER
ncbi:hypothetical protein [Streptomyces sp. NRRL B-24484]|uniref:Rv1733c family protein n=1 Tax=Streptomyces sp. NRRL B-24484 TaxID=1463833 RepID=UPI000694B24B|nr:hypothetical protein [Streptomyces sp. NRRL B-24484]